MKEFLVILFLGKVILLTQNPVALDSQWTELTPSEPLSAINSGASIQVDVSSAVSWGGSESIVDVRKRLLKKFPSESIKAKLISDDGMEVILIYKGNSLISKENILLPLYGDGIPAGKDFKKVMIYSDVKIDNVFIYWKNYKK